jgi:ADP-ribose pyrophosphatase YjhB (NUDIX family)
VSRSSFSREGGFWPSGGSLEQALQRELFEELGVVPCNWVHLGSRIHQSQERQNIHYFAIESWTGTLENHEAESLLWIPLSEIDRFDLRVDRMAIGGYLRSRKTRI